jgi:hypothetical protein
MAAIHLDSPWFRCYSRALFTDDPTARHMYAKSALDLMHEILRQPGLKADERQAISVAIHELNLLQRDKLNN